MLNLTELTRSVNKVVLHQELYCQSITEMPWISFWSLTNFFVTYNNCFTVRCGCQDELRFVEDRQHSPCQCIHIEVHFVFWLALGLLSQVRVDFLEHKIRGSCSATKRRRRQWFRNFLRQVSSISWIAVGETIRRSFTRTWMGEDSELGMYVCSSETRVISVSKCGWHQKLRFKSRTRLPCGRNWWNVDIDEPTSFPDHAYVGCTQRERKPNETIIKQHKKMCKSRISAGATEKLPLWQKPHAQTVAWSYDMEGHAKKNALSDTVNFINSNKRNWNHLENCQKFAHKLSWHACTWQELDDLTSCGP